MARKSKKSLIADAQERLEKKWAAVCERASNGCLTDELVDTDLVETIKSSVNCKTKTYRYVLPTQVLAKLTDHSLDCRSLQAGEGKAGSFDARTIAHSVIVPFDGGNQNVLGGSEEPYVSNPLRVPSVSVQYQGAQKDGAGWGLLCKVLDRVEEESNPIFTESVLTQILVEIHRRLAEVHIVYPAPLRISLGRTIDLVERFLVDHSGGDRAQAVACAAFQLIGKKFGLFATVRREVINAADASTGLAADIECLADNGEVVLAVEVKDKELTVAQIENKIQNARSKKIANLLFVAQKGVLANEHPGLPQLLEAKFAVGQNAYVFDLKQLLGVVLALMPEGARPEFLQMVGHQLDEYRSDLRHRRAWRELLGAI